MAYYQPHPSLPSRRHFYKFQRLCMGQKQHKRYRRKDRWEWAEVVAKVAVVQDKVVVEIKTVKVVRAVQEEVRVVHKVVAE